MTDVTTVERMNWAGSYTFTAPTIARPDSVPDVQRLIEASDHVRALGTRHSFTDLADTDGTLIDMTGLPADIRLDEAAQTVTVGAGCRYGVLAEWLHAQGWALHNMGSLPHISVGGAVATGTHGSGNRLGILSTAVIGIEYVNADGDLVRVGRQDPSFAGYLVHLGAYGIIVRVTLAVEPTYDVRQDVYSGLSWEAFLADHDAVFGAAYSVNVLTRWSTDTIETVWMKSRVDRDVEPPAVLLDGTLTVEEGPAPVAMTERGGVPGPWSLRLPHFRLDATPSLGEELQSEYYVDRADAPAALRAVRELADRIDPILGITELRTTAPDELWLSGSYQRDTLAIAFTWLKRPEEVAAVVPELEAALSPFAARPHWGKVHKFSATEVRQVLPRADDARQLFTRLDSSGKFSNSHLRRLGIR